MHSMACKQLGSWIRIFSAGISGLIFSKCDRPLQWSAPALNSQRRKGKNSTHYLLGCSLRETLMRNLFFQTCFPDKFSSRDHSTFKLFCDGFVCVTIASKTWEQEDGEISSLIALHKNGWVSCHASTALSDTIQVGWNLHVL